MDPHRDKPARRQAGLGATMRAVFWSFFGVRKRKDYEHDAAHLNPVRLIVAALVGVLIFIGILVLVVHIAVSKA
jgi:amino acid transporter